MKNEWDYNYDKSKIPEGFDADTFCPLPFVHSFYDVRGWYTPCCNANYWVEGNDIDHFTLNSWFYGEQMTKLRDDIKCGVRNEMCGNCWRREEQSQGKESPRIGYVKEWLDPKKVANPPDYNDPEPVYFDMKSSNHCNLACMFCNQDSSDKITKVIEGREWEEAVIPGNWMKPPIEGNTSDPEYFQYIQDNIEAIRVLKFTGGEPFLNDEVNEILQLAADFNPNVYVVITTNGTVIKKEFYPTLRRLRNAKIKFSIDGLDKVYDYVRWPSEWTSFERKITETMQSLPDIRFNISCLVNNLNLEQAPKIREWFVKMKERCPNLEFITFDPGLNPSRSAYGIEAFDHKTLSEIHTKMKAHWDERVENNKVHAVDASYKLLIERVEYLLEHNHPYNVDRMMNVVKTYNALNNIRGMHLINEVAMPITKAYFSNIPNMIDLGEVFPWEDDFYGR